MIDRHLTLTKGTAFVSFTVVLKFVKAVFDFLSRMGGRKKKNTGRWPGAALSEAMCPSLCHKRKTFLVCLRECINYAEALPCVRVAELQR